MTASTADAALHPGQGPLAQLRAVWGYRELLAGLVRKELKVKYKNSSLGFVWSTLNPAMRLVVFYFVFEVVLKTGIPNFAIYLLCGLMPWTLFSQALAGATTSVVGNAALVKKVYVPREIFPLATIGAELVHFVLQLAVLGGALIVFRHSPSWEHLPLLVPALVVLLVLLAALSIFLAAVNVYLRDVQHLLDAMVLLAWFWLTPIVYEFRLITANIPGGTVVALANPLTPIILVFQRAIYGQIPGLDVGMAWHLRNLAIVGGISFVLLLVSLRVFARLQGNFAEEL